MPDDGPVGSKHVAQLLVELYKHCTTLLCNDGPIKYTIELYSHLLIKNFLLKDLCYIIQKFRKILFSTVKMELIHSLLLS